LHDINQRSIAHLHCQQLFAPKEKKFELDRLEAN
jgi:hypothetical protein